MNKVLILGVSLNENRVSNRLVRALANQNFQVYAIGRNEGFINGMQVRNEFSLLNHVHTVTLYLNAKNQKSYYDLILKLNLKGLFLIQELKMKNWLEYWNLKIFTLKMLVL